MIMMMMMMMMMMMKRDMMFNINPMSGGASTSRDGVSKAYATTVAVVALLALLMCVVASCV